MPHNNQPQAGEQERIKTILVVEDDPASGAFFVQAFLQETPYQPLLVTSGSEALKAVRDIKPDLLLIDYRLPDMNGFVLYDQLHATKELEDVPTILMTAGSLDGELEKRNIIGLNKPFELDKLLNTVEGLLESGTK